MDRRIEFTIGTERLVADLHLPDELPPPFPCVVTSHGYKSHRNSEKYFQIGHRFPLEGIAVLRFDHRGALGGESDGAFEDTTLSRRIEDLLAAIDALRKVGEIDSNRVGLLGSSLGGMDVLLITSDRIKAKVVISTPYAFPPPSDAMRSAFAERGYCEYADGTRVKKEFYEDLKRFDLKEQLKQTTCPVLIVHGDLDEVVPRHHARVLYQAVGSGTRDLHMIPGGDHAFTDLEALNRVLRLALDWFKRYL